MSDDAESTPPPAPDAPQSTGAPASDAPSQAAPETASPTDEPPADFGTQESFAEEAPPNFGEQLMTRGGLPKDLEQRIEEIDKPQEA